MKWKDNSVYNSISQRRVAPRDSLAGFLHTAKEIDREAGRAGGKWLEHSTGGSKLPALWIIHLTKDSDVFPTRAR